MGTTDSRIIAEAVNTAEFNREKLEASVNGRFVCATELADTIVMETDHSFRTAYHIVASIANDFDEATIETIQAAANEITGDNLTLDEEQIKSALDSQENVEKRDFLGGPREALTAIEDAKERLKTMRIRTLRCNQRSTHWRPNWTNQYSNPCSLTISSRRGEF